MTMGYPGHCPCKPRTLMEDVAPKMELRSRQVRPGNLTLLLPPNWLQPYLLCRQQCRVELVRGNQRKGGQDYGGT